MDRSTSLSFWQHRVSPLSYVFIARLELQGAVTGLRLALTCSESLGISSNRVTFWTDSNIFLQWISSKTCRFPVFVANRVAEIREASTECQWRHVPGHLNPANDCNRGLFGSDLSLNHRWLRRPKFLKEKGERWPELPSIRTSTAEDPEVLAPKWCGAVSVESPCTILSVIERHSEWLKVLRILAWALRFGDCTRDCTRLYCY